MLTVLINLAGQDSITIHAPEDGPGTGRHDPLPHTRALLPGVGSLTVDLTGPTSGRAHLDAEQSVLLLVTAPEGRTHPRLGRLVRRGAGPAAPRSGVHA